MMILLIDELTKSEPIFKGIRGFRGLWKEFNEEMFIVK